MECLKKRFPKFIGSSNANTRIDGFDIDSVFNIVLAGISLDPDFVVNYANTPCFVSYFPNTGFEYLWAKELTAFNMQLTTIQFKPDSTSIMLMYTTPMTLLIMDTSNGDILA